ncbi:MAG: TetR/AcrR family transcriptional regulator [Thalassobaculales bacterium]
MTDAAEAMPELSNPRAEARRQAILEAAAAVFMEKGFAAASLSDIVRRSGGSLSTLYQMFGNKQGLFRAIVADRCRQITEMFEDAGVDDRPPREALTELGHRLFGLVMGPEAVPVLRLVVAESGNGDTAFAEAFFTGGPENGKARVAEYLAGQARRGLLALDDPREASEQFCSLVLGKHHVRALCGLPHGLDEAGLAAHIARQVDAFLKIYGRPGACPGA